MQIKVVGVIGAGTMGNGIAQIAAEAGFTVIMRDLEEKFVQKGLAIIEKNLNRAVEKVKKPKKMPQRSGAVSRGPLNSKTCRKPIW